jgi:AraC-like DNA-binding protein
VLLWWGHRRYRRQVTAFKLPSERLRELREGEVVDVEAAELIEGGDASHKTSAGSAAASSLGAAPGPEYPEADWEKLQKHVADCFTDPDLTVEDVARHLGWSVSKLNRILKARAGTSFTSWWTDMRLDRASRMLRETDFQVAQVALDCGFNTPAHFNRVFKERFGITPTDFRKAEPPVDTAAE